MAQLGNAGNEVWQVSCESDPLALIPNIDAKEIGGWKNGSGYQRRGIAENTMYRLKQLGDSLYSRTFGRQVNEAHVRAAIINTFTYLGLPQSVREGQVAPAA